MNVLHVKMLSYPILVLWLSLLKSKYSVTVGKVWNFYLKNKIEIFRQNEKKGGHFCWVKAKTNSVKYIQGIMSR